MTWLLIAAGAAVGAPLRYLTDRWIALRHDSVFPWGTFAVNVAGSALLGVLVGAITAGLLPYELQLLLITGFCGALTTYSTFSYETVRLAEDGAAAFAIANVVATIVAGLLAFAGGAALAGMVW
ncbi:fluoride efflux transporter CrcB [Hoyosella altamirensis]|uniref:Fluoride-specific ion channel FluC n=1 Tax=Hoyosella altamirensis TaxID=616997 RepID=A0A839RTK3_9ACTN|nr:fluoride efflux transporter CrcB [Hoyosella altamirensis]MBB3039546.1 CrcB protein [Hoyosella altamirensis]